MSKLSSILVIYYAYLRLLPGLLTTHRVAGRVGERLAVDERRAGRSGSPVPVQCRSPTRSRITDAATDWRAEEACGGRAGEA